MDLDVDACYRAFRTRDARFDGRLFAGVCGPICPARLPKRENMTFYAIYFDSISVRPPCRSRKHGASSWPSN